MEQTATKQLYFKLQQIEFYYQQGDLTITEFIEAKKEAFLQAEQTFKQQIIDSFDCDGCPQPGEKWISNGEQYYKQTYEQQ